VDDYEATLSGTSIAPATATQGDINVGLMQLDFGIADPSFDESLPYFTVNLDSIKLHNIGDDDADIDSGGVILYEDTDLSGDLSDNDNPLAAGTLSGGYVTLDPPVNLPLTSSGKTFFIAINIATDAGENNGIALEIENPFTDVVFNDIIDDTNPVGPTYAFVSVEYVQQGYVDSTTAIQSGTITISPLELEDVIPPEVAFTSPRSDETDVALTTEITVVFSEEIESSTISSSNFTVEDSRNTAVSGTVSASGSSAVFAPSGDLDFEETYTVTVLAGVEDLAGNSLAADYTWDFTTRENVPEPVAANNRILPGSSEPVRIYIPEPAGGPNERVTVQVYTTTGRKVATLVNNRPYSQIRSQQPLLWYGKNGSQQNLGPGLYFIQVRSGSTKKVLKVLIVR
jgi:hypothetical protein